MENLTPPPELVQQWWAEETYDPFGVAVSNLATCAAQWGADQELEACIDVILAQPGLEHPELLVELLRDTRRPKPPSLAEEAMRVLVENGTTLDGRMELEPDDIDTIRCALWRLQQLEEQQ